MPYRKGLQMLPPLHESHQRKSQICYGMYASAPSARTARTQGRGGASQSEAGGWPASIQGETEGAKKEEEKRQEDGSYKSADEEDNGDDDDSKFSTSRESDTEEPTKPPA